MYKIKNKTDGTIKYMKVIFAPQESKILELVNPLPHENFIIEKIEEIQKEEKKPKMKGGLK